MKGTLERRLYRNQAKAVVGIDEAGRGSLAGPVSVSAVVFPDQIFSQSLPKELKMIRDSKELSREQRETCYDCVQKWALFADTVYVSNRRIDRVNINNATELGILYLVRRLQSRCFSHLFLLVDGNFRLPFLKQAVPFIRCVSIIKGDRRVLSIAAASVVAKVDRDRRMQALDRLFPEYQWKKNKGYPTLTHRSQIERMGMSPLHRFSYQCRRAESKGKQQRIKKF